VLLPVVLLDELGSLGDLADNPGRLGGELSYGSLVLLRGIFGVEVVDQALANYNFAGESLLGRLLEDALGDLAILLLQEGLVLGLLPLLAGLVRLVLVIPVGVFLLPEGVLERLDFLEFLLLGVLPLGPLVAQGVDVLVDGVLLGL